MRCDKKTISNTLHNSGFSGSIYSPIPIYFEDALNYIILILRCMFDQESCLSTLSKEISSINMPGPNYMQDQLALNWLFQATHFYWQTKGLMQPICIKHTWYQNSSWRLGFHHRQSNKSLSSTLETNWSGLQKYSTFRITPPAISFCHLVNLIFNEWKTWTLHHLPTINLGSTQCLIHCGNHILHQMV